MGVLKIKTGENTWETIDNLSLDELKLKNTTTNEYENIEDKIQNIADNAAISVYIEVYSKQFREDGEAYLQYRSDTTPGNKDDGYSSLEQWFNYYPDAEKTKKGFLIEHRTVEGNTYHLPYYWNGTAWTLLNAIWG